MTEEEKCMRLDFSLAGDDQIQQIDRMRMRSYFETARWSKAKRTFEQVCVASDPMGTQVVVATLGDLVVASFRLQLVNTEAEFEREAGIPLPFEVEGFPVMVLRRACVLSMDYWECFKALHCFCLYIAGCMTVGVNALVGVMAAGNPLSQAFKHLGDPAEAECIPSASSTFAGKQVSVDNPSWMFPMALGRGLLVQILTGMLGNYSWKGGRPFKQFLPQKWKAGELI